MIAPVYFVHRRNYREEFNQMKTKNVYRILAYFIILSVFTGLLNFSASAEEEGVVTYTVVSQPNGLFLNEVTYKDGQINVKARLGDEKMTSGYNAITFTAQESDGTLCAIRECEADNDGKAEFSFRLGAQTSGREYTFRLSGTNVETLVSGVAVFNDLSDALNDAERLISLCEDKGISTDYERLYLSAAERSYEIMQESGISEDIKSYNRSVCIELISKARQSLVEYLNGSKDPLSVPRIDPKSVKADGKNLVGTVSDGECEYKSPVFLNGYNMGYEDRDETDFLNRIGVNTIPYTININRVIGKPDTAYMWTPSGKAATDDKAFVRGEGGTLKICNGGNSGGMLYRMISLKADKTYAIKFKAKGKTSGNVSIAIGLSGRTDFKVDIPSTDDWTEYEYTYIPNAAYVPELRIRCGGTVEGAFIDDVSLTDENGKEMLINGGFEEWFDAKENDSELFGVNTYAIEKSRQTLELYGSKGYTVVLSGEFAAMPEYVLKMNGVRDKDASYGTYVPYNPTHPMILSAIKTYLTAVLPVAKECGNTVCFMIHNEPSFNSYGKSFYEDEWAKYLEEKYSDISRLNEVYKSEYANFKDVPMQNTDALSNAQKLTVQYYDWRVFNDSILTEYHNVIKGYIDETAPEINVGTKIMQEVSPTAALVQHYGTDYESFGTNMSINANDGWARPESPGQTIQAQMMWYDFQTSVNKAPVFNMENHFAADSNTLNYNEDYADWVTAMLWQGALHGLSGSQSWLWGRSDEKYPYFINTTVQYRADVMARIGKAGLDINRLAEEVAAFREKAANAAILYSETSKSYNRQYENAVYQSYLGAMYSGVKTDLICESKIGAMPNYEMLVIPEVTHTTDAVVDEIYDFVQSGGKVLMLADDCLKYNCDGKIRTNLDKVNAIKTAAKTVNGERRDFTGSIKASVSDAEENVRAFFDENNALEVELTDENNNVVTGVEISTAEKFGKTLINLCSYSNEEISVYVKYNGEQLKDFKNLIDNNVYNEKVTLKPNTPVLLTADGGTEFYVGKPTFGKMEFGSNLFSPDGSGGTVSEENVKFLSLGYMFASINLYNCEKEEDIILAAAIKNGDMLKRVSTVQKSISIGDNTETVAVDANDLADGDYLELFLWKSGGLIPLNGMYRLKQRQTML